MVMGPAGPDIRNDRAVEDQQQITDIEKLVANRELALVAGV
jgi:hypothetical protein